MAEPIYLLNGPNLNLLGEREPEIYGHATLADIEAQCHETSKEKGYALVFRQSNHEGELIDWVQEARLKASGLIINAAALTHTSVALYDALLAVKQPVIELHISQIHRREPFRRRSYVSKAADAVLCGFGVAGYTLAIEGLAAMLQDKGA